ncbi:hypothetical protein Peur_073885 [Populus x canadensis]
MRCNSFLKIPKEQEQAVPDTVVTQFSNTKEEAYANGDIDEYPTVEDEEGFEMFRFYDGRSSFFEFEDSHYSTGKVIKEESLGFWDGDEKRVSLHLNLNYQEVLDAWSDRGSLLADDYSLSMESNCCYKGEVPVMEEDRTRREASVLRYKEKRQTRLKGRFVKRVS